MATASNHDSCMKLLESVLHMLWFSVATIYFGIDALLDFKTIYLIL